MLELFVLLSPADFENFRLTAHFLRDTFRPCLSILKVHGKVLHFLRNTLAAFRKAVHELLNEFHVDIARQIHGIDLRTHTLKLAQMVL